MAGMNEMQAPAGQGGNDMITVQVPQGALIEAQQAVIAIATLLEMVLQQGQGADTAALQQEVSEQDEMQAGQY